MEQLKQELSLLLNTIDKSFPDENDLKGFLGISKALIVDLLKESDTSLSTLMEYNNHFETIILKRELSDLFKKIKKELGEKYDNIKPVQFNFILKTITRIKFLIRETYISIVNQPILRTEAEIAKAKEELNMLVSNIAELKKINSDLTALKDSTIRDISAIITEVNTQKEATVTTLHGIQEGMKNCYCRLFLRVYFGYNC
jgi:hypothetical protein